MPTPNERDRKLAKVVKENCFIDMSQSEHSKLIWDEDTAAHAVASFREEIQRECAERAKKYIQNLGDQSRDSEIISTGLRAAILDAAQPSGPMKPKGIVGDSFCPFCGEQHVYGPCGKPSESGQGEADDLAPLDTTIDLILEIMHDQPEPRIHLRKLLASRQPESTEPKDVRKWLVRLCWPTDDNPFNKFNCIVDDIGYADRIVSVSCPEAEAELAALKASGEGYQITDQDIDAIGEIVDFLKATADNATYKSEYHDNRVKGWAGLLSLIVVARRKPAPSAELGALEKAESEAKALREALEQILSMPDYDQDNEFRLRTIARAALFASEERKKEGT
jgi:hypothetical protein